MKITYDAEVDALYIQFLETTVTTEHLAEGLAADYDAEGRLAGIEILDALKRFGSSQTLRQVNLEDVGLLRTWVGRWFCIEGRYRRGCYANLTAVPIWATIRTEWAPGDLPVT